MIELVMRVTGLLEDEVDKDDEDSKGIKGESVTYYRVDLEGPEVIKVRYGGKSTMSVLNQLGEARLGQRFKVTIEPVEPVPAAQMAEDEGVFK